MSTEQFTCGTCGALHDGPPLSFAAPAPDFWQPEMADQEGCLLDADLCVIAGEQFFVRGLIELPVWDTGEIFTYSMWVSLSRASFTRAVDVWEQPGREKEPPYFGWLSNIIAGYEPSTLNLRTNVHTRAVGQLPYIELEPTGHPLAVEQLAGVTRTRVEEIAAFHLHR
ncbi:hypothetical protein FHR83_004841 [Actinoplanes campanulatus]|uniref:DUF2199 domain-containing protein n=1 Tax=Actinoplanes campanulatus TaxID=113559 RepID=A0A7W5FG50_9ACTN|nr:DUF2199 domain-containing protein [Actinoplanes campanulatus]MBB3097166.1 hypothetical protein [Actinoplanes campanulatus]GGN16171.1 hypothetical protein GCM10010109_28250 [Actinoplanes campanulatus]GID37652.1 hypothetical protein Aca09nite_41580 [Actinoplanes campanulatus]